MRTIEKQLGDAVGFHLKAYVSITNAKNHMIANCDAAQEVIDHLNSLR